jgi:leucyl aminopeptidase (aminopeptidase T)
MFGPFSPELEAGARNAIEVCLAIQPRERVALIADEASREVAASLAAALAAVGAAIDSILIEQIAARPLTQAPPEVLDALERAEAGILCVHPL